MFIKHFKLIAGSLAFLLIATGIYSCLPDYFDLNKISDEIEISPGIAAPIAFGSLSMADLLDELDETGYINTFDDSLLYITYSEEVLSFPASEVVEIPDQQFLEFFISSDIAIPSWLVSGMGDTITFLKEQNGDFQFNNNERIDSIYIKTTNIGIHVESSFKHTGILTISSDFIIIDGEPFHEVIQISDPDGTFVHDVNIPLDGHILYFDNSDPSGTYLPLKFKLDLINSGNAIDPSESCDITMDFNNIQFSSIFGYFGDYDILQENGSVIVDLFSESLEGGKIFFNDPRFALNITNSYGIPLQIELYDVETYSTIEDITTPIVFTGVNPFDIAAPGMDRIGDTAKTLVNIDKTNCNIDLAMQTSPKYLYYSAKAITNPLGPEARDNFLTDSSTMKVDFEVVLPIDVRAGGFSLEDTTDFNFEDEVGSNADMINYFRLTLDAANGLPFDARIQAFFADQNDNILDSMFVDDHFILSANLDANGKVNEAEVYSRTVEFTGERINTIKPTTKIFIRANVETKDYDLNTFVKFYSYYTIDFKLKFTADLTINSNDF